MNLLLRRLFFYPNCGRLTIIIARIQVMMFEQVPVEAAIFRAFAHCPFYRRIFELIRFSVFD